jgi:hypothetical protein
MRKTAKKRWSVEPYVIYERRRKYAQFRVGMLALLTVLDIVFIIKAPLLRADPLAADLVARHRVLAGEAAPRRPSRCRSLARRRSSRRA